MIKHLHVPPVSPQRVLVLGGSGFVGGALCRLLRSHGTAVVSVTSSDLDLTATGAGERLAGLLRSSDSLVFASAITRERGRDVATLMRNLTMAQAVAEALDRCPCAHTVYLSSDAVYGDLPVCPLTEASPCQPTDLYGVMHLTRERMLEDWAARHAQPLLIVRPTLVYGVGDTHAVYGPNRFMRTIREQRRIRLFGTGDERRDHIHVDDLAEVIRLALFARSAGVVNVATGIALPFSEIAELMRRAAGADVLVESTPAQQPVAHRYFDIGCLSTAFPGFAARPFQTGVASLSDGLDPLAPPPA